MNALYVTSVVSHSGKTAVCLALARHFQSRGKVVGYLKPLSTQPWMAAGKVADEDAAFVRDTLGLAADPTSLSPVVITRDFLRTHLRGTAAGVDLMARIEMAYAAAREGKDIVLLEGGASLREGYAVGLATPAVAKRLGAPVLAVVRYYGEMRVIDDALTARFRLNDQLAGVILNHVPEEAEPFVRDVARPYLERQDVAIFGALPQVPELAAMSVDELVGVLGAEVLTEHTRRDALVEAFTVGAMTAEAALTRFRQQPNKAVVTGGDRTDIQLAALETSTVALVLTGNLRPSPVVLKQADDLGVAVLLVRTNTIETVEAIDRVFGKTRLGQAEKLRRFEDLFARHVDLPRLSESLGIG